MDGQTPITKENSVIEQPNNAPAPQETKTTLKKKLDTIFTVVFSLCIFLVVFAGIYYLGTGKSLVPQISMPAKPTGVMSMSAYPEVTQKTQIVKTLAAFSLPPKMQWTVDQTGSSTTDKLADITADKYDEKVVEIPFSNGTNYTSNSLQVTSKDDTLQLFVTQAKKEGWIYFNNSNTYLSFKSFRLQGEMADGPCGGSDAFAGYKDGQVRMIAISHTMSPCKPQSINQNGNSNNKVTYHVFISDPTPINYFTDYLAKHSKK